MKLTPEILASPDLMEAWAYGAQRIMEDEGRTAAERVRVGQQLIYFVTRDPDDEAPGVDLPRGLPSGLQEPWEVAFSDHDDADRLAALLRIRKYLSDAAEARDGDAILRREFGV